MNLKEAECRRFLRELGRGIPDDQRIITCYKSEVTDFSDGEKKAGWPVKPYREDKYIPTDSNCFVAISSSKKTLNRQGKEHYWRGTASFGRGLAIMVDDIGNGIGSKGGIELVDICKRLMPSAIVQSSPNNFQCWYFLKTPEPDVRWFKAFLVAFVENVLEDAGGDPTIRDVSRLGRMPIGINNKRLQDGSLKYPGKYGAEVGLYMMEETPARYDIEEIAAAFEFEVREPPPLKPKKAKSEDKKWFNLAVECLGKAKMGEGSGGRMFSTDGRYRIQCPWADTHGTGNPFGAWIWSDDYKESEHPFVFGCSHHACKGRGWTMFVDAVVIPYVISLLEEANDNCDEYEPNEGPDHDYEDETDDESAE